MAGVKRVRLFLVLLLAGLLAATVAILRRFPESGIVNSLRRAAEPSAQPFEAFGSFHFVCLGICIFATATVGFLACRYADERLTDRLVFAIGVAFLLLEGFKQILYNGLNGESAYDFTVFRFSSALYRCTSARSRQCSDGGQSIRFPAFSRCSGRLAGILLWHIRTCPRHRFSARIPCSGIR